MSKKAVRGLSADMLTVASAEPVPSIPVAETTLTPKTTTVVQPAQELIRVGHLMSPEAIRQFEVLKAELAQRPEHAQLGKKRLGPRLIGEALNLLFEKYGKEPVNADF